MYKDELKHYGVKGMKWGVRRASRKLAKASTTEERNKALSKLNTHKTKATNKVNKLKQKQVKLQKDVDKHVTKTDVKVAKLKQKIAKMEKRYRRLKKVNPEVAENLYSKISDLKGKEGSLEAKSAMAKAKLEKNKNLIQQYEDGISTINKNLKKKK